MTALLLALLAGLPYGGERSLAVEPYTTGSERPLPTGISDSGVIQRLTRVAPLVDNGELGASMPPGLPQPDVVWLGSDPTGANGHTTHTFTAAGSPASVSTPYGTAMRFDGTNDYYTGGDLVDMSEDFSVAASLCIDGDASGTIRPFGQRDAAGTGSGWMILANGTTVYLYAIDDDSMDAWSGVAGEHGECLVIVATVDLDGDTTLYVNGTADPTPGPTPTGSYAGNDTFYVGRANSPYMDGDIAGIWIWRGTVLTSSQVGTVTDHLSRIADAKRRSPATFVNDGPVCTATPPSICYGDDLPVIDSDGHLVVSPSVTNQILSSEDLSTDWTEVGSGVITCGQSGLGFFADGREYCKVEDDNAAAGEYTAADWSAHGLSNGAVVTYCLDAAADDGSQVVDTLFREVGGACTGGATNYGKDAHTVTTSPARYCWTHTIQDDTCDDLKVYIVPYNFESGVGETGHTYVTAVQLTSGATEPGIYCSTSGVARTCGGDAPSFDISGSGLTVADNEAVAVADSDMEAAGTDDWSLYLGAGSASKSTASPHSGAQALRITHVGTSNPGVAQNVFTAGRTYRITGWGRGDGEKSPIVYDPGGGTIWTGTSSTDWQYFDETWVSDDARLILRSFADTLGQWVEFDDIKITDITEELRGTVRCSGWFVPGTDDHTDTGYVYALSDGTNSNLSMLIIDPADRLAFFPAYGGGAHALSSVITWGAAHFVETRANYETDVYQIYLDGELVASDSTDLDSPLGLDKLSIGNDFEGDQQLEGSATLYDWRCSR